MQHKKLLLVEDDPTVSRVLERAFGRAGYDVVLTNTADRALRLLRTESVDGLITNMQTPHLTGRELCERLREGKGNLPPLVLVVTSRASAEERRWAEGFAPAELVEKPVGPRRLLTLVETKLNAPRREEDGAGEEPQQ